MKVKVILIINKILNISKKIFIDFIFVYQGICKINLWNAKFNNDSSICDVLVECEIQYSLTCYP